MKTNRVLPLVSLVAFLTLLLLSSSLAQVQVMSTKELTEESSSVLLGTCTRMESYWADGNSKIFTRIRIRGQQYIKGDLGAEAEITVPGGRIGDVNYEVSDMPVFREGEEVLLFVWSHPTGKQLVIGGTQGKFSIETDKTTGKKVVVGVELRAAPAAGLQKSTTQTLKGEKKAFLDDFLNEVRGYVKK
jgi:hypothetical protein